MSKNSTVSTLTVVGTIILFIVFAWLPLLPCVYTGPDRPGSETIISESIVCPINPFLVRDTSEENYRYFGMLDRANPLHLGVLYLGNILFALLLSWFFFQWVPKKISKGTPN